MKILEYIIVGAFVIGLAVVAGIGFLQMTDVVKITIVSFLRKHHFSKKWKIILVGTVLIFLVSLILITYHFFA